MPAVDRGHLPFAQPKTLSPGSCSPQRSKHNATTATSALDAEKQVGQNVLRNPPEWATTETGEILQVSVRDNNIDQALRVLKKRMQRDGVFRDMKAKRAYEKPSEKRIRKRAEAIRRRRKLERKQALRESGALPTRGM